MILRLVFCFTIDDKRSTFFRENKHRRNYTEVFVTMKKRFYRELNMGLWNHSQDTNHYTIESDDLTACVFVENSRQAFYIF